MILKIISSIFLLIVLSNCGFKPVDQNYFKNYNFIETNISGDKRIVYLLQNKFNKENKNATKSIKIDINTTKEKKIREKNIQNEITKYEILLSATVNFYMLENNTKQEFKVFSNGDYNVNARHSETLNNEKKLIKNLVNNISDQIIRNLKIKLDEL